MAEVVDGPYVVALATDTDFENHVQARVSWSHDEVGELIGGIVASWMFCGHDYEMAGVGGLQLP
ncbi:MAG: hypothetical protein ACSLFN_02140 [Candidatus Limnocylindrales bacterium]